MSSSLKFGTSGLRGLSVELQGAAARRYTAAFVAHLRSGNALGSGKVFLGRDFRDSSAAIANDCASAIAAAGLTPIDCGVLPTPALALHAMAKNGAAIMVTGSHIPSDRNGLKFYTPAGEIGKADEAGIAAALEAASDTGEAVLAESEAIAAALSYVDRYTRLLAPDALKGWTIGVFEHSTVARDMLAEILSAAGGDIVRLGRVETFVAVDTEAFGDAVFAPLKDWVKDQDLDAIVSADGDGDRPLLMDGAGNFVRGDVLGLLAAKFLGADTVVTPVTSNSAIERTGYFPTTLRTKVGSPFVIAGMEQAARDGARRIVGFEANGGTLLGSDVTVNGNALPALPTRDAVLPLLGTLITAAAAGKTIAELVEELPVRPSLSNRLEHVPTERTKMLIDNLRQPYFAKSYFAPVGEIARLADIDGLQFSLSNGGMVHYRPSGNAPELRCYVEANTPEAAEQLLAWGLGAAEQQVRD